MFIICFTCAKSLEKGHWRRGIDEVVTLLLQVFVLEWMEWMEWIVWKLKVWSQKSLDSGLDILYFAKRFKEILGEVSDFGVSFLWSMSPCMWQFFILALQTMSYSSKKN